MHGSTASTALPSTALPLVPHLSAARTMTQPASSTRKKMMNTDLRQGEAVELHYRSTVGQCAHWAITSKRALMGGTSKHAQVLHMRCPLRLPAKP